MGKNILHIILILLLAVPGNAQQPSQFKISRMDFNNDRFSTISPVIIKDGILFCSDRRVSGIFDRTGFNGKRLYNIYIAEKNDTSGFQKPQLITSERTNKFNNGPLCVAADGKTVYFTSEIETGKIAGSRKFINHSGIFIAELSGSELGPVHPFKYNNPSYNVGQPSLSADGKYLYFASDMPDGNGNSDIYYCELVGGEWSAPVNLGSKVNSSASENYPFIHPSGRLYFTSDRPGGPGKLDVYFTSQANGVWDAPEIMPEPINSPADDFAFTAETDLQGGYFTSNRKSGDEIYKFTSSMIRKASCDSIAENNYCYRFTEENAVKLDSVPFRYIWKFGDGDSATGVVVEHCFKGPGIYTVQLDATNLITKEVNYNEKSEIVEVTDIEQAYISAPDRVTVNQEISLNADSTNLPGWKIARYYWNFGDESIAMGNHVSKRFQKPGKYNVQLIVTSESEPGSSAKETCVSKNIIVSN
jgi:hypothetical protein